MAPADEQPTQKEESVDDFKDDVEKEDEDEYYVYEDKEAEKGDEDEKKESKMSESQEDKTLQEVKGFWCIQF